MSIFEMLRDGFENLGNENEKKLEQQINETTDLEERKNLEHKLKDQQKLNKKKEEPKEESMAEAIDRRLKQREKNKELSKQIKRHVICIWQV